MTPLLIVHQVDDTHAKPGCQNSVERTGGTTALDVPQSGRPRFNAGCLLDEGSEHLSNSPEPRATEGIKTAFGVGVIHGVECEALCYNDQRRSTTVGRGANPAHQLVQACLSLGDEDGVSTSCHSGVQRDPPNVAAHDLCDHAAGV